MVNFLIDRSSIESEALKSLYRWIDGFIRLCLWLQMIYSIVFRIFNSQIHIKKNGLEDRHVDQSSGRNTEARMLSKIIRANQLFTILSLHVVSEGGVQCFWLRRLILPRLDRRSTPPFQWRQKNTSTIVRVKN
jgi:hypothetical protein